MTTDFAAAINADPADMELRLVYADWLEEQGDETAAGWRWLVENGKTPFEFGLWGWASPEVGNAPEGGDLPESVFASIRRGRSIDLIIDNGYESPFAALEAAAAAVVESGVLNPRCKRLSERKEHAEMLHHQEIVAAK